jgi:4'-phosphopantetheinyl transferase
MSDTQPFQLRWRSVGRPPVLTDSDLHVWRLPASVGDAQADHADLALLSPRQLERMRRLVQPLHRRRYLRTQASCRRILAHYVGVEAASLRFRYGLAGKPAVDHAGPAPEFNLTTAGDLALLAVSATLPVGIDCEVERVRPDVLGIAERMFTADAIRSLAGLSGAERQRAFYLQWTALEARVKADGRGLARHREPAPAGLSVAHALAGEVAGQVALCAVARQALPTPEQWHVLQLASD